MTFTDAELDQLTEMLAQGDQSKIGYYGPKPYNRDGKAAIAAITYLRAQLSERDPIGAAIMRERAIDVLDDTVTGSSVNSWVAIDRASNAIKDLPLPTPADVLSHALQLPEIKALVEAAQNVMRNYLQDERDEPDLCVSDDHWTAIVDFDAALAALEPKP